MPTPRHALSCLPGQPFRLFRNDASVGLGHFFAARRGFPSVRFFEFRGFYKEGSQLLHEPGQEIIRPLVVSDHPCHFEVVTGLAVVAVDTSSTE